MKFKLNSDEEVVKSVQEALKKNEGYCPCVVNSYGKRDFKCPCREFRQDIKVNELCHCGLYLKTGY